MVGDGAARHFNFVHRIAQAAVKGFVVVKVGICINGDGRRRRRMPSPTIDLTH